MFIYFRWHSPAHGTVFPVVTLNYIYIYIYIYGLEACPLNVTDYKYLQDIQYSVKNAFMKLFATKSNDIILAYQKACGCKICDSFACRKNKFVSNLI